MTSDDVLFRVTRRGLRQVLIVGGVLALLLTVVPSRAQKVQERYKDKFKITEEVGTVSIATSADGQYVFVAGNKGVLISNDFGKTGSWVQTVVMK